MFTIALALPPLVITAILFTQVTMKVVINRSGPLESSLPGFLRDAVCRRLLIADKEASVIPVHDTRILSRSALVLVSGVTILRSTRTWLAHRMQLQPSYRKSLGWPPPPSKGGQMLLVLMQEANQDRLGEIHRRKLSENGKCLLAAGGLHTTLQ